MPDVLVIADAATWLFDVRPAKRIRGEDLAGFVAAARVAAELGWRYAVVSGWRPQVMAGVEALSAYRRRLDDPLGMRHELLAAAAGGACRLADLVEATSLPAAGRAHLRHLLWHHRLEVDWRCRWATRRSSGPSRRGKHDEPAAGQRDGPGLRRPTEASVAAGASDGGRDRLPVG